MYVIDASGPEEAEGTGILNVGGDADGSLIANHLGEFLQPLELGIIIGNARDQLGIQFDEIDPETVEQPFGFLRKTKAIDGHAATQRRQFPGQSGVDGGISQGIFLHDLQNQPFGGDWLAREPFAHPTQKMFVSQGFLGDIDKKVKVATLTTLFDQDADGMFDDPTVDSDHATSLHGYGQEFLGLPHALTIIPQANEDAIAFLTISLKTDDRLIAEVL